MKDSKYVVVVKKKKLDAMQNQKAILGKVFFLLKKSRNAVKIAFGEDSKK